MIIGGAVVLQRDITKAATYDRAAIIRAKVDDHESLGGLFIEE